MIGARFIKTDEFNWSVHAVAQKVPRLRNSDPSLLRAAEVPASRQRPGSDIFGGLVLFRTGLPITEDNGGARWLALHLAACFGRTGLRYEDRMRWVMEREDLWQRITKDPVSNPEWAGPGVTDPWSALAAALEWAAFRVTGFGMPSRLPIPLNADDVSALMSDIMPTSSEQVPREVLSARWAEMTGKVGMVVKDDGAGVYATHAATAGALAHFLGDASTLVRSIIP